MKYFCPWKAKIILAQRAENPSPQRAKKLSAQRAGISPSTLLNSPSRWYMDELWNNTITMPCSCPYPVENWHGVHHPRWAALKGSLTKLHGRLDEVIPPIEERTHAGEFGLRENWLVKMGEIRNGIAFSIFHGKNFLLINLNIDFAYH